MLHKTCSTPVKQRYYCPTDDRLVERDEIAKGYEYAKGQYVLFTDEELKALNPEPTNSVDITEFVPLEEVDPVYFDSAYYLGPDKAGDRAYRLLARAMRQTGRAALATLRGARQELPGADPAVRRGGLVMQQLRYADEVRSFSEVPLGAAEVKRRRARPGAQAHRADRQRGLQAREVQGRGARSRPAS